MDKEQLAILKEFYIVQCMVKNALIDNRNLSNEEEQYWKTITDKYFRLIRDLGITITNENDGLGVNWPDTLNECWKALM